MSRASITLGSLLRLAATDKVNWLHTKEGNDIFIQWVVLDLQQAIGGEALLILADELSPSQIRTAEKAGIQAIIAIGALEAETYEDVDLPIASISITDTLNETYRTLITILVNQRAHLLEWGTDFHAKLDQIATEADDPVEIINYMAEVSGKAVVLQDKRMDMLATAVPDSLNAIWDTVVEKVSQVGSLPKNLQDRKQAGRQSVTVTQNLGEGLARMVSPINVKEMARGYLSVIGIEGELDTLDQVLLEQGVVVCGVQMARSKAVRETEKRVKSDLLGALLRGELSPRDIKLWSETIGLDLVQPHVAMRLAWDSDSPPSQRRLETLVNAEVSRLKYKVIVSKMESEVVCFCQESSDDPRPEYAITLGRSVIDRAMLKYPGSNPRCGIGTAVEDLSGWRDSFRQAGQSLEMALRLHENKPMYFSDMSVYRLLMQIEHSPELKSFQVEILGPLLEYDNGTELIRTLEAYFERNGNLKKTANALYIHRNTLIYRMERIQEITGLDLNNPETRLALQLTLRIYKMLGEE
jgi:purine catabolism regulator